MRIKDLTPEMFLSVPCPECKVAAGKPCVLHSGGVRVEPHVDRKLAAIEAIEKKIEPEIEGHKRMYGN